MLKKFTFIKIISTLLFITFLFQEIGFVNLDLKSKAVLDNDKYVLAPISAARNDKRQQENPWTKAASEALELIQQGHRKILIVQPMDPDVKQRVWQQVVAEGRLGNRNGGIVVYTRRPEDSMLREMKKQDWLVVEFQVEGLAKEEEEPIQNLLGRIKRPDLDLPVVTIPVPRHDPASRRQVMNEGWQEFVDTLDELWKEEGDGFSPVKIYKERMKEVDKPSLDDLIASAGNAVIKKDGITLVYDGLLSFVPSERRLDSIVIAYGGKAYPDAKDLLDSIVKTVLIGKMGYFAKWGQAPDLFDNLMESWFGDRSTQIPILIAVKDTPQEAAVAVVHRLLVEYGRPTMTLILDGPLDESGREKIKNYFDHLGSIPFPKDKPPFPIANGLNPVEVAL